MPWHKYSLTGRYYRQPKEEDVLWKYLLRALIFMVIDIVVCSISIISSFYVFVAHVVKPTERGFYCNDDSIRRPYYPNTVSTTNLLIITLGLPLPMIFLAYFFTIQRKSAINLIEIIRLTTFVYLDYVVGFGLSTFSLDFLKCFIGRLRPNFVSMCKPDLSVCDLNSTAYVTDFECLNGPRMGRNSRTSFPSGHSMAAVHVDSFLYDEEDLDKLAEKGQLSRHYCKSCGSRDVGPLTFISHSLSISQLRYVFNFALPYLNGSDDFRSKVLLDIGSRLGSVIYSAAEFWNFKEVIGIEMNTEFCDLQQKFLQEKNYSTPIHVVCDDVRNQQEMLASANVVLMNNVFGYFQDLESQVDCWQKIRAFLQPGTILIHNPSVEAVTEHLKLDFALHQWLEPIDLNTPFELYVGNDENLYEDLYEECEHISAYRVIPPSS